MLIGQFGAAFLSFMSVAYIPSFLEDRSLFIKERANGLYGPISFMISNFITGAPFLCKSLEPPCLLLHLFPYLPLLNALPICDTQSRDLVLWLVRGCLRNEVAKISGSGVIYPPHGVPCKHCLNY